MPTDRDVALANLAKIDADLKADRARDPNWPDFKSEAEAIATARAEGYREGLERAAMICAADGRPVGQRLAASIRHFAGAAAAIRALAPVPDRPMDSAEVAALRHLLWLRHGCGLGILYGDDGEMQCGLCRIDFKRDPVHQIEEAFRRMGILATLTIGDQPATGAALPPTETTR